MLPTGDSVAWNAVVVALWFPYCMCWFIPVYFIHVPCKLLLCRVNRYIEYVSVNSATNFDVVDAMRYYDKLCAANKSLKTNITMLFTTSSFFLVVHGVALLMVRCIVFSNYSFIYLLLLR